MTTENYSILFFCSDGENIPDTPVQRPNRRAKVAAADKTKQDLATLLDQEANGS